VFTARHNYGPGLKKNKTVHKTQSQPTYRLHFSGGRQMINKHTNKYVILVRMINAVDKTKTGCGR
jgi:hypothetical protein